MDVVEQPEENQNAVLTSMSASVASYFSIPNIMVPKARPRFLDEEDQKLEKNLSSMFFCIVCLELPRGPIYQCKLGHLMCEPCICHIIVNASFHVRPGSCPGCRIPISMECTRNLVAEKLVLELSEPCKYCSANFLLRDLKRHTEEECEERPAKCPYWAFGCEWPGNYKQKADHAKACAFSKMCAHDLAQHLQTRMAAREADNTFKAIFDILSSKMVIFVDLYLLMGIAQSQPVYESAPFKLLNCTWIYKIHPNLAKPQPLTYQLCLMSPILMPITVKYVILKGPYLELDIKPKIYTFTFDRTHLKTPLEPLETDYNETIHFLSKALTINLRLFVVRDTIEIPKNITMDPEVPIEVTAFHIIHTESNEVGNSLLRGNHSGGLYHPS